MGVFRHSIQVASRKSGLTPHVIRMWERRYRAVEPERTETNRRLYSDVQVERLSLLRGAVSDGYRIGNIVHLPLVELKQLIPQNTVEVETNGHGANLNAPPEPLVERCLAAVRSMDAAALEGVLVRALTTLGGQGLLIQVVSPLAARLGDEWQRGSITAAQEHFASAVLRGFLAGTLRPFPPSASVPCLIVGTLSGQIHELGAIMAASAATNAGWRVIYLGPCLPASEIAGAAALHQARAVALSIVYPADDPELPGELRKLASLLPVGIQILLGGRAAQSYGSTALEIGASVLGDLADFSRQLETMRSGLRSPVSPPPALIASGMEWP